MARARKTQTNNAAQPAGGSSLSRRVFAAAVVAALVLVSAVLALQILATEREAARNLEQARLTASAAASRLNAEAEGLRRLLQSVAATLPDPLGGPEATAALERTQASIGKNIRLRAVPAGLTDPDPSGPIPISYSTLELLRQRAMQDHWLAGKEETFAGDPALAKGIRAMGMLGGRIREHHNVSGEDNASRLAWTSNLVEKPAGIDRTVGCDTVYFVGCVSAMFPMSYAIPQGFVSVMQKARAAWRQRRGDDPRGE